jgi:hypothetical protein
VLRIKKGENALVTRFLKNKDKTEFPRTAFSSLDIDLIQNGRVITSYAFPSTHLRAGDADNEITIEISTAVSDLFVGGKVLAKYTFVVPDADFVQEVTYTDIITEEILFVEQTP